MAIYNISYKDKETDKLINEEMGNAYSLIKKLQLGGIGSRRMVIEHFSKNMNHLKLVFFCHLSFLYISLYF